jgi:hypothetical protein
MLLSSQKFRLTRPARHSQSRVKRPDRQDSFHWLVYEANAPVMIWSLGPDKNYDWMVPATQGVNKDNVLSWK